MAYNVNEDDDDWDSDDLEDDEDEDDDDEDEYDEDPELDDDEEDYPRPNKYLHPEDRAAKEDAARSRRMIWSGIKILLSVALLGGAAAYLFVPSAKEDLRQSLGKLSPYVQKARTAVENVKDRFSGKKEQGKPSPERPPVLRPAGSEKKRPEPLTPREPVSAPAVEQSRPAAAPERIKPADEKKPAEEPVRVRPLGRQFNLSGAGDLPDLQTAMKTNPSLKETLLRDKSVYTLERLWEIRSFVRDFIYRWAGVDGEKAVAAKVRMPYATFERRVLAELLPFTTFRAVGLTPSYDTNRIKEPPLEAIGKFYLALSPVLADQTTEQGVETLRPVVNFMQNRCGRDKECTEALERMIQMLGYDDKQNELMK